eukprot:scaffold3759_cov425-Prasinococcus_capsulatus_cf.AAC.1
MPELDALSQIPSPGFCKTARSLSRAFWTRRPAAARCFRTGASGLGFSGAAMRTVCSSNGRSRGPTGEGVRWEMEGSPGVREPRSAARLGAA